MNDGGRLWVKATVLEPAGIPTADHQGVLLHLHSPDNACKVWKQPKVFSPPTYAEEDVRTCIETAIKRFHAQLDAEAPTADIAATMWDTFKADLVIEILRARNSAKHRLANTYRQKLRRLQKQKSELWRGHGLKLRQVQGVPLTWCCSVLQLLSLNADVNVRGITSCGCFGSIPGLQVKPQSSSSGVSYKFADNIVPTLKAAEGCPT